MTHRSILLLRFDHLLRQRNEHPLGVRPTYLLKYVQAYLSGDEKNNLFFIDQNIFDISCDELRDKVLSERPEVIVTYISTLESEVAVDELSRLKGNCLPGTVFIAVGQDVTARAEYYKSTGVFDFALKGEAELEVCRVITALQDGKTKDQIPVEERINIVKEPDVLPFPEYSEHELDSYDFVYPLKVSFKLKWGHVLSSRGCTHGCVFCSQLMRESYGNVLRRRSAVNIVDEIESLLGRGANIISIDDDDFTNSRDHVISVCNEIQQRGLKFKWITHARIDEVDEELLLLMKKAGCVLLRFGVESVQPHILSKLKKTASPGKWRKRCECVIKYMKQIKISSVCLFIVGSPGETFDDFNENVKFAEEIDPDIIQVAYFTPFPGSEVYEELKKAGEVDIDEARLYHYGFPDINLSSMSDDVLKRCQALFYRSYLLRPIFAIRHFLSFWRFYLYNPEVFFRLIRIGKRC